MSLSILFVVLDLSALTRSTHARWTTFSFGGHSSRLAAGANNDDDGGCESVFEFQLINDFVPFAATVTLVAIYYVCLHSPLLLKFMVNFFILEIFHCT